MGLTNIFKIFVPKEKAFFPLFEQGAKNLVDIAEELKKLMNSKDIAERDEICKKIKELENVGDEITHQIYEELNRTFITPFDREDIHGLASQLDDVADFINTSAQRIRLYKPLNLNAQFANMADVILSAANYINIAIKELHNIKHPEKIKEACINIDSCENQADDLYHLTISELFANESDNRELFKKKEILESLETACDKAEDVSDILKTILIKFA